MCIDFGNIKMKIRTLILDDLVDSRKKKSTNNSMI